MYYFYLDDMQLPVTPAKLEMKISNQNKTISLINGGEIAFLKSPGLTEVSFEASFPQVKQPYAVYPNGFQDAEHYLVKLKELKKGREPFRFIITRMTPGGKKLFSNNLAVSLEEYKITEDAKDGSDVSVSIKLREYREYATQVVNE